MTCYTIFIEINIISYNIIVKFGYNVNIKKFVVRLVSMGKPTISSPKNARVLLGYGLRWVVFALLYGLSLGYRTLVQLRLTLYQKAIFRRAVLPCPVISIGNITTGGTGKTPMVILIAQLLRQHGKRVVILSRGYRRRGSPYTTNILVCDEGASKTFAVQPADVRLVGDEPLFIARKFQRGCNPALPEVSVIVGSQRYLSGKLAIERFQPNVILLDDGFQHLQLHRTFDLVLIGATNPFGGNYLLPAGFLREPVENLARAHAFVITRSDEIEDISPICQRLKQINPDIPIFKGRHVCDEIRKAGTDERIEIEMLKGKRLLGVSGLANPASFHHLLDKLGIAVIKYLDFPDHHWYTEQDVYEMHQTITAYAIEAIITTEKDEAKLSLHPDILEVPIYIMTITIDVQPEREFENVLLGIL